MDRRSFLTGLIASTALATCPTIFEAAITAAPDVEWQAWFEQWQNDAVNVMVKCWEDQIIYGVSAHRYIDIYPFVEHVDPVTLELPRTRGGLFND